MISEARAENFTADQIVRNELTAGMDGSISANAVISGRTIVLTIYNNSDKPIDLKPLFQAYTVITKNGDRYEIDPPHSIFGREDSVATQSSVTLKPSFGAFKGKKEDIRMLVCSFDMGDTKLVLLPAEKGISASIEARQADERILQTPDVSQKHLLFQIHEVDFSGNKAVSSEELRSVVAPFLNRDINYVIVQDMIAELKEYYRSRDYMAAYVYVPPQNVTSGVLQVTVAEGIIADVNVTGNRYFSKEVIQNQLDLKPNQVLKYDALRAGLNDLNSQRDIQATAVIKPGPVPGTTDVNVKVQDRPPFHMSADMDNFGNANTGKYELGTTVSHDNLTGRGDQASARFQGSTDAWALLGDYNAPVNSHGTRLGVSASHAVNHVGGDFSLLNLRGDATDYGVYALQPVYRSGDFKATFKLGFDWKEVENRVLDELSDKESLKIVSTGFNLEQKDAYGQTFSPHSFSFGFDDPGNNQDGESLLDESKGRDYFVYRGSVTRQQRVAENLTFVFKANAQLSRDSLPSSEQFSLGGVYSVRGYSEGQYLADMGGNGSVEMYVPLSAAFNGAFPKNWKLPYSAQPLGQQIQLTGFVDWGYGELEHPLIGETKNLFLAGTGGGFRVHLYDKFYGRLEWALPVTETEPFENHSSYYFGISYELF